MKLGALDRRADADDRPPRVERLGEQLDHRRAPLEQLEQPLAGFELLGGPRVAEQPGRAADVELRSRLREQLDERRPDPVEERPLARATAADRRTGGAACSCRAGRRRPARSGTPSPTSASPPSTGSSVSNSRFVTPPVVVIRTTITTRGCSASTSTWRTVADSSDGADTSASSRVACESISVVDCSAASSSFRIAAEIEREASRPPLDRLDELLGVDAGSRSPSARARRRVRMRQQTERLELGELPAHRGRRGADAGVLDERLRARPAARSRRTPRRRAGESPASRGSSIERW